MLSCAAAWRLFLLRLLCAEPAGCGSISPPMRFQIVTVCCGVSESTALCSAWLFDGAAQLLALSLCLVLPVASWRCTAFSRDCVSGMLLLPFFHYFSLSLPLPKSPLRPRVETSSGCVCVCRFECVCVCVCVCVCSVWRHVLRDGITLPLNATAHYVTGHHCFTITAHLLAALVFPQPTPSPWAACRARQGEPHTGSPQQRHLAPRSTTTHLCSTQHCYYNQHLFPATLGIVLLIFFLCSSKLKAAKLGYSVQYVVPLWCHLCESKRD